MARAGGGRSAYGHADAAVQYADAILVLNGMREERGFSLSHFHSKWVCVRPARPARVCAPSAALGLPHPLARSARAHAAPRRRAGGRRPPLTETLLRSRGERILQDPGLQQLPRSRGFAAQV